MKDLLQYKLGMDMEAIAYYSIAHMHQADPGGKNRNVQLCINFWVLSLLTQLPEDNCPQY